INRTYFGGKREITCYSCHRGGDRPRVTPSLAELYGPPPPDEPDTFVSNGPATPKPDEILAKYIQALGGSQKLDQLKSFAAKGSYKGFSDPDPQPVDIYARLAGPGGAERATIVHTPGGDTTTTYSARDTWKAAPTLYSPTPVLELTGGERDG